MRHLAIVVLCTASFAFTSGFALADCRPMTLTSDVETRHGAFVDLDGSGSPSPGDKRMGERILTGADGQQIGTRYWVNTVSAVDDDGKPTEFTVEGLNVFEDGTVFDYLVQMPASDYADVDRTVLQPAMQKKIIGGTKAYAGARGTIEYTIDPDTREMTLKLNISCE